MAKEEGGISKYHKEAMWLINGVGHGALSLDFSLDMILTDA